MYYVKWCVSNEKERVRGVRACNLKGTNHMIRNRIFLHASRNFLRFFLHD